MSTFADTLAALRAEKGDELLMPAPAATAADLNVGWFLWEKAPEGTWYNTRGGVVLHIAPLGAHDPETGEAVDRYTLIRAEDGRLHWLSLRADQVAAVDDGCRPNAETIRGICRVAAREIARGERRRSPDDERDLDLWSVGVRLMATLARPGTVAP